LGIFTIVFLLVFFKFPAIHHVNSTQLNNTNLSKVDSPTDGNVYLIGQYRQYTLRIDNIIFLLVSGLLVFIFSYLNKREKQDESDDDDDNRSGIAVLFLNLFQ
jgi:uncharacterized membrane protein